MIDKNTILKQVLEKEDKTIISNILDKYIKYDKTNISTYTNFLDTRILNIATNILNKLKVEYNIYEVIDDLEKKIIYFGDYEDFITIYKFKNNDFKHNEILGTLFSIGLEYDAIGDIFIEDDYVYFTNLTRLNPLIEHSLYDINKKRIKLEKTNNIILTKPRYIEDKIIVPSYRLDVIVSKLACFGRNDSLKYIKDGLVLVNYLQVLQPNKIIKSGDIISIRKKGKFIVEDSDLKTKKDNYLINIKKYN